MEQIINDQKVNMYLNNVNEYLRNIFFADSFAKAHSFHLSNYDDAFQLKI
jgi:hypothetical protein